MSDTTQPQVLGTLLPEELQHLGNLRQQAEQILRQVGLSRLAEFRLLQQHQHTEHTAQVALRQVGARLGIPDGTAWQLTSTGQVILVAPSEPSPE